MNQEYINNPGEEMFILLAPLDWGLGHATRCIPLIYSLQKYRATVILAGEGPVAALLKQEFPHLQILPLKGYRIRYAPGKKSFLLKILSQLPKIQSSIYQENKWLNDITRTLPLHGIISDNRLGLHSNKLPSVYITHQLKIETGLGWINKFAQLLHYKFINQFTECWVPDLPGKSGSLGGNLSHPINPPRIPVKYLGSLSRFKTQKSAKKYDLLVLLSGPEPQRTIFEKLLLGQVTGMPDRIAFVRGLPGERVKRGDQDNVTFFNHLPAAELNALIDVSALVIARAGYSTIMDLAALQKKAILVPTPGQGEQEYLARYMHAGGFFYTCNQDNFLLKQVLSDAALFSFAPLPIQHGAQDKVVYDWLMSLRKRKVVQ